MTYSEIQKDILSRTLVKVSPVCIKGCKSRMHAHLKERTVCKWIPKNSVQCTFDLFHEIGHIMTNNSSMRRCEEEYSATQWAIDSLKSYGVTIPKRTIDAYQDYINDELNRGKRRGGSNYPASLNLMP